MISAWIRCGHCNEPLTRLTLSDQEPLTYSVDLQSGLCTGQPKTSREGRSGPGNSYKR